MGKLKSGYIQLGAQRVGVRVVSGLYKRKKLYGDANFNKNEIRIAGDTEGTLAIDTLFHEIVHFLLLGNSIPGREEEYIANALGRGLASLLRDNPEWIRTMLRIFREEAKCQPKSTHKQVQTEAKVLRLSCKPKGRLRPRQT